jgi:integrase
VATMTNPTGKHRPKRRHHGEGTVLKRTDRWRAKPWVAVVPYTDPSGKRREMWLSASSRDEADGLRKREIAKRAKRIVPTEHTVGSYVRNWLMTTDLGPWTFDRYRHHIEQRIEPTLGAVPLADLTPPMVRQAMTLWTGAPATRMGAFVVLRTAMRQALADRMVEHDPTENIRAPRPTHSTPDVVDIGDARRLMDTVRGERFAPLLVVSLGLGIRRGELLGLRTPDVDLAAGTVTIRHSLRRVPVSTRVEGETWWRLVAPKRDSGRTIPLPAFVADALRERLERRDAERKVARIWAPNDLVFSDVRGNPIGFTSLDHWWKGALERAKLPDMRWHELRASTATILLAEGVPEMSVMAILGHRSLEMTRRYVKLLPRVSRDAADRMGRAIG